MRSISIAAMLLDLIALVSIPSGAQTTYSIRRLHPAHTSFTDTRGGINRRGQVAGSFVRDGSSYAYIWDHGSFRVLGKGVANGINSLGQVVGVSSVTNHATLWKHGHALDLGTLGGDRSVALGMNRHGVVVGYDQQTSSGNTHAFQWESRTGMLRVPDFGGLHNQATGINSLGKVVGWSDDPSPSTTRRTVIWEHGTLTQFFVPDTYQPTPNKINNRDQVLVQSMNPEANRAIEVQIGTAGFSVNLLPNFTSNLATDINNPGTVVGYDLDAQGSARPFVCLSFRQVFDLNTLIPVAAQKRWVLQVAQGINDRGQIVGFGTFDGIPSGFLLTPSERISSPSCF